MSERPSATRVMDFVLVLHAHLPHVIRHERWPHGSDWLMEAVVDSYLPLLDMLDRLGDGGTPAPMTVGVTPVLAAQLRDPTFAAEFRRFLAQRLAACDADEAQLARGTDAESAELAGVVRYWRTWYAASAAQFDGIGGDVVGALRAHEQAGRIELMSSAATHGFLPLLGRDESIQLQLLVGRTEHQRIFGRAPAGCWLPECAYRPSGTWAPLPGVAPRERAGIETFMEESGYRFVVVDAHLAHAGQPLQAYGAARPARAAGAVRSAYGDYTIGAGPNAVRALVRDPVSTRQVWSRDEGYPGAGPYLEFHKMRFPGGLRLWEVTGPGVSLGDKRPYNSARATEAASAHARHFVASLDGIAVSHGEKTDRVIVAPFDAELFGHWWFEGPEFLAGTYRCLRDATRVQPASASTHIARTTATPLELPAGSWGRGGDFGFWLNDQTAWMWRRLWELEDRFWNVAASALSIVPARRVLAQAARSLLLAQSSDWPFMVSTGEVPDYGIKRFTMHADDLDVLVSALESGDDLEGAGRTAANLAERDAVFHNVIDVVESVVTAHAALA